MSTVTTQAGARETGAPANTASGPPPRPPARADDPARSQPKSLWRRLPRPLLALSWLIVALVLAWALIPGLFAPYSAYDPVGAGLEAPSPAHLFGTDQLGRDQFARVVYGARESLLGAALAVTIGAAFGVFLGTVAGSLGGAVDAVVMRVVDVLLAVPGLLLALVVVVLLGPGTLNASAAVGVGSIATFARLVRAEVVRVRRTEYVEAAYGSGGSAAAVLARHILPNSLRPVLALLALNFGSAILALSTLGFLGFGVQPPDPEWGMIIAQGRNLLDAAWWATACPGLVLLVVVLATNRISRSLGARR
jgi:peptide/nickel transport system permease protein